MRVGSIAIISSTILASSLCFASAKVSPKDPRTIRTTPFVTEHTTKKVSANPVKLFKSIRDAFRFYSKNPRKTENEPQKKKTKKSSRKRHRKGKNPFRVCNGMFPKGYAAGFSGE